MSDRRALGERLEQADAAVDGTVLAKIGDPSIAKLIVNLKNEAQWALALLREEADAPAPRESQVPLNADELATLNAYLVEHEQRKAAERTETPALPTCAKCQRFRDWLIAQKNEADPHSAYGTAIFDALTEFERVPSPPAGDET